MNSDLATRAATALEDELERQYRASDWEQAKDVMEGVDYSRLVEAAMPALIERAAELVECGCAKTLDVQAAVSLHGHNSAARWNACGRDPCGAILAAEIRALAQEPPA